MELKNEDRDLKIVFKKVDGKLEVRIKEDEDFYYDGYSIYEVYENIDFEAFIKNIENIKDSKED